VGLRAALSNGCDNLALAQLVLRPLLVIWAAAQAPGIVGCTRCGGKASPMNGARLPEVEAVPAVTDKHRPLSASCYGSLLRQSGSHGGAIRGTHRSERAASDRPADGTGGPP
jgi:hypothetical protein